MPQSLSSRVEQVHAAAVRLRWLYGLSRTLAAIVVVIISLGLVDFVLRPNRLIVRGLLSAAAVAVSAAALQRLGWPALAAREQLVTTAQRIEQRFPQLGERLSSAIAFLHQSPADLAAGSSELRQAVIADAEAHAAGLDFRAALNRRAPRLALASALAAFGLASMLLLGAGSASRLAIARLAMPWRDLPWPQRNELEFVQAPQRVASGDPFEAVLIDRRGKLPERVELLLRHPTPSGPRDEQHVLNRRGNRMVFRLDNVLTGFDYRARGGDDDRLPWTTLTVVKPPQVVDLQVRVTPPPYTGLGEQTAGRVVKTLAGSTIRVRGRLDRPIRSIAVKADKPEAPLPLVELAANGRSFTAGIASGWIAERSANFAFELTDANDLTFRRDPRIDLQVVADAPPAIAWEAPVDPTLVTARANVAVKGVVKDDLAIRSIQLRYIRPGRSDDEQVHEIFAGPPSPPLGKAAASAPAALGSGDSKRVNYRWDLSQLAGLVPGDVLTVRLTADDYLPQLASTSARRLTIISLEELLSRISSQQAAVLGQIAEALRLARQCREQTRDLEERVRGAGQVAPGDANQLAAIQHNQGQVARLLDDRSEGAAGQIAALLAELESNQAADQPIARRLNRLSEEIGALNQRLLPAVEQELGEAIKAADAARESQTPTTPSPSCGDAIGDAVADRLQTAAVHQTAVIQSLESLVGRLTQWDGLGRAARELAQIRDAQERLLDDTDDLKALAAAAGAALPAAERATSQQLAQRELELARRFDALQARLEEMLAQERADDPRAASPLAAALPAARRLAIGGQMREAASRLAQQQFSPAAEAEQAVLTALAQLHDRLTPPQAGDPGPSSVAAATPTIAELLLVKAAQEEINRRTAALDARRMNTGQLTAKEENELAELARQQGKLAEVLIEWTQATAAAPSANETRPDRQPDPNVGPSGRSLDAELLRGLETSK